MLEMIETKAGKANEVQNWLNSMKENMAVEPMDRQTTGSMLDSSTFRVEYMDGSPSTRAPNTRISE